MKTTGGILCLLHCGASRASLRRFGLLFPGRFRLLDLMPGGLFGRVCGLVLGLGGGFGDLFVWFHLLVLLCCVRGGG